MGGRGRVHYAWIVAAVTFVTLLGAAGFRSTPGVLMTPLEQEFGWTRATISLAVSVNLLLYGFSGPFAAALMLRFGLRRVVVGALLTVSAGALLTTQMREPWQLILLWGVVVGLGAGFMATVLAATVASRWFVARRGLVLGVLTAAAATGQLVFLPLLASLTTSAGWRSAAVATAAGALLVVPLAAVFLRDWPRDVGEVAYGATADEPPPTAVGNPIGDAFAGLRFAAGRRDFWLLGGTFFVCGLSTSGLIGTHLIPAGIDHGMGEVAAASMLALIGVFDIIGTTASGWLTDRMDSRKLLFVYYGLRGASLLVLPMAFASPNFGMIAFIVFYGLDWVATVPPTIALTTDLFGRERGPIVFGWVFTAHQIGAAVAATGAGVIRTVTGDYWLAFVTAGALCLVAAAMALAIGSARSREAIPAAPLLPGARLVR
ncbi:MAG: MFS transporter [Thermomicrobiales bacterium]|nr:MFS transporter [Thermomicrobiales bacterium]